MGQFAPRVLGTTTAEEIRERGVGNMKARALLGDAYETIIFPIKFLFLQMAKNTAAEIEAEAYCAAESDADGCDVDKLKKFQELESRRRGNIWSVILAASLSLIFYASYADYNYGGPIHGKGACVASIFPTFNLPDEE